MKLDFGNYIYFDPYDNSTNVDKNKYAYNESKFNELVAQGEYEQAYNLGIKYIPTNNEARTEYMTKLEAMRMAGNRDRAIFNNITDDDEKFAFRFAKNVFSSNGTDVLDDNNPYKTKFNMYKQALGGNESTYLEVKFSNPKNTFLGIDWIAKDDDEAAIDTFYKQSGLSKDALEEANIFPIVNKDGDTVLRFSKSHPLSNNIIYVLSNERNMDLRFKVTIEGLDDNGKRYTTSLNKTINNGDRDSSGLSTSTIGYNPSTIGYNPSKWLHYLGGDLKYYCNYDNIVLDEIGNLIDSAKEIERKYDTYQYSEQTVTSTIAGNLNDHYAYLNDLLRAGRIDKKEYRASLTDEEKQIDSYIRSMGVGKHKIYSNAANKNGTDMILRPLDLENEAYALNMIAQAEDGDISIQSMISNGEWGCLITINPSSMTDSQKKNLDINSTASDMQTTRKFQFFIPGLFHDKVQERAAANSQARATQEVSQMQRYNYDYTTKDGVKIKPKPDGTFDINSKPFQSASDAVRAINLDIIITEADLNFKAKYTNTDGQIVKEDEYEEEVKRLAWAASNELWPNTNMYSYDDTWAAATDGYIFVKDKLIDSLPEDDVNKLQTAYDIYQKLINSMYNYKNMRNERK